MISRLKRFLFGCKGCQKAKNEIDNHKDWTIICNREIQRRIDEIIELKKEIQRLQEIAQDYSIEADQLKDKNISMNNEIVSLQTVRDNLIGERKDFNEQQKIVLDRLEREKDAHKLTRFKKDLSDKEYKDLAIQNKRMLDIVNDEVIMHRLLELRRTGKLKDIEEYYANGEQSIEPLGAMMVMLGKDDKWQSVDVLEGVTPKMLREYNKEAKEAAEKIEKEDTFVGKLIKDRVDTSLENIKVPNLKGITLNGMLKKHSLRVVDKKESKKHVRARKKDSVRQVQT